MRLQLCPLVGSRPKIRVLKGPRTFLRGAGAALSPWKMKWPGACWGGAARSPSAPSARAPPGLGLITQEARQAGAGRLRHTFLQLAVLRTPGPGFQRGVGGGVLWGDHTPSCWGMKGGRAGGGDEPPAPCPQPCPQPRCPRRGRSGPNRSWMSLRGLPGGFVAGAPQCRAGNGDPQPRPPVELTVCGAGPAGTRPLQRRGGAGGKQQRPFLGLAAAWGTAGSISEQRHASARFQASDVTVPRHVRSDTPWSQDRASRGFTFDLWVSAFPLFWFKEVRVPMVLRRGREKSAHSCDTDTGQSQGTRPLGRGGAGRGLCSGRPRSDLM